MAGLADLLAQSSNLGSSIDQYSGMRPDLMRAELARQLAAQGRQMDLSTMQPEQMLILLRALRQPIATTGIRG